jgi:hypothetical protein
MGKKKLNDDEVRYIFENFQQISISDDSEKEIKLIDFFNQIERDLDYVGTSGVEDKLQDVYYKYLI